ncbi:MAG: hypothetical protein JO086_07180 [Acidimicrobiia bacterium]|nr:hypothetical protein [Acidimicrobiia bacterium]
MALAVAAGDGPEDVSALARQMFRAEPLGGALAASLLTRCISAVNVYLASCLPLGWELVGVEEPLAHCRLDLLWHDPVTGVLVVDELKTSRTDLTNPHTATQVRALCVGGAERWGNRFGGVRVVTLAAPRRTFMVAPAGAGMRRLAPPPALAPR